MTGAVDFLLAENHPNRYGLKLVKLPKLVAAGREIGALWAPLNELLL